MPFDETRYQRPAMRGDLGYNVYMMQHALKALADSVERIADAAGVDVGENLALVRDDISDLQEEFDKMTGWQPE